MKHTIFSLLIFFLFLACASTKVRNLRKLGQGGTAQNDAVYGSPVKTDLFTALKLVNAEPVTTKNIFSGLTKKEYRYIVMDLLEGKSISEYSDVFDIVNGFNDSPYKENYNNLSTFSVFNGIEKQHLAFSKALAKQMLGSKTLKKYCQSNDQCFDTLVSGLLPRLWRKSISESEKAELNEIYNSAPSGKKEYSLLVRAFISIYFHNKIIGNADSNVSKANQIGSLISFSFTGSLPDETLQKDINSKAIEHPNVAREHIKRLLSQYSDRFSHLFVSQWLSYSALLESPKIASFHDVSLSDITAEMDKIFSYLIKDNENISSFFEFKYNVVNAKLAKLYDQNLQNNGWEKVQMEGGNLFSSAYMSFKFVTPMSDAPNPILRGKWIVSNLLCQDMAIPSADEIALAQEVVEKAEGELKNMGQNNPSPADKMAYYRTKTACASCHNQFDFHGLALEEIGLFGQKREKYYTGGAIDIGEKVGDITYSSSDEFVEKLGKHSDVNMCFMSHLNQYFSTQNYIQLGKNFLKNKSQFDFIDQLSISSTVEDIAVHAIFGDL